MQMQISNALAGNTYPIENRRLESYDAAEFPSEFND